MPGNRLQYHVTEETPVVEWKSEIGHKIERITACEYHEYWQLAFECLATQLNLMKHDFLHDFKNFKDNGTNLTEEELKSLCDTACKFNDIWKDINVAQKKYESTLFRSYVNKCFTAFKGALVGIMK